MPRGKSCESTLVWVKSVLPHLAFFKGKQKLFLQIFYRWIAIYGPLPTYNRSSFSQPMKTPRGDGDVHSISEGPSRRIPSKVGLVEMAPPHSTGMHCRRNTRNLRTPRQTAKVSVGMVAAAQDQRDAADVSHALVEARIVDRGRAPAQKTMGTVKTPATAK